MMFVLNENKKLILAGVAVAVLLGVVGLLVFKGTDKQEFIAKEFIGKASKIENGVITAAGAFVVPENEEWGRDQREVVLRLGPGTKIIKTLVFLPTREELSKTGGYFDGSKLKREDRPADINALMLDAGRRSHALYIKASENIYGKKSFMPDEVRYEVEYIPEFDN